MKWNDILAIPKQNNMARAYSTVVVLVLYHLHMKWTIQRQSVRLKLMQTMILLCCCVVNHDRREDLIVWLLLISNWTTARIILIIGKEHISNFRFHMIAGDHQTYFCGDLCIYVRSWGVNVQFWVLKKLVVKKEFVFKKIVSPKKFGVVKIFGSEKNLWSKIFVRSN